MDNNMNNSNDMNNSINNMNNNAMPDKSTAEGKGLYTEAVQMHSECRRKCGKYGSRN